MYIREKTKASHATYHKKYFFVCIMLLYFLFCISIYITSQSSSSPFPTRWGQRPEFLISQNVLSWASSGVIRSACISLRTQSTHLPLGLPLGLFPGTIMSTTALTRCFLPFSVCVHTSVASFLLLFLVYYSLLTPF